MTAARDLALARQRNYQLIIDTTLAWSADKGKSPWGPMYRVVTAAVAKAAGVVFADTGNPDQVVAAAAVRLFLDQVPLTGSIVADVQSVEPTVTITAEHEARARDIIDHWDPTFFVADLAAEPGPKGDTGPAGPRGATGPQGPAGPAGGARTSRGSVWAEDLPGSSLADKLRQAWGSDDRRDIRAQHGDTLDAGTSPIQMRPGSSLVVADSRQTEFSDSGRLFVRGSTAVFDVVGDMKGARLTNVGFEGQSHLGLFAAKPTNNTAGKVSYPIISGCSADSFRWIIEAPTLGPTIDFGYINNVYGPHAFKLAGSDGTWFPLGCKIDWGQSNSVVGRTALIVCTYLEKTSFGPFYMTCEGSTGLLIEGSDDRTGLTFVGATIEGRNASEMSAGALVKIKGAASAFVACNFNYGQGQGRDKGYIDAEAGYVSLTSAQFKRGSSDPSKSSPLIARRGTAVVDTVSCRVFPSKQLITATNL